MKEHHGRGDKRHSDKNVTMIMDDGCSDVLDVLVEGQRRAK